MIVLYLVDDNEKHDIDNVNGRNKLLAYYQKVYDEEQQKFDEKLKRNPNYRFVYVSKWN